MPSERTQRLSTLQNGVVGAMAGGVETLVMQPTSAIKNALQQHHPINWSIRALYRGVGISLVSFAPVSAMQFALNGHLLSVFHPLESTSPASDGVKIAAGAIAGGISSLICSPAGLIMTLQQNTGKSCQATVTALIDRYGVKRLFRGLEMTMIRESIWCACYLALGPVFTQRLHLHVPSIFGSVDDSTLSQRASATVVGSVLAGLVALYATQPFDTIKTVMQGEALRVSHQEATSPWKATARFYHTTGRSIQPFYRGSTPRAARLIGGVFILTEAREFLEEWVETHDILGH
ncbi:hypothetical protein Poli38472_012884 [Pythium oligandrum]|uniref:Mitochondrial carrier protein n=1 Tax=Pythium oligandrum TaxID=41045 RepID=A0A8K1FLW9_PYTOL|nr:hypothetical protein Poli38472_012884 [Pythium oligandrum]|eukprot:TMW64262.1 hypothetical protein Poli38472_012884 [Pythium oligandrum]